MAVPEKASICNSQAIRRRILEILRSQTDNPLEPERELGILVTLGLVPAFFVLMWVAAVLRGLGFGLLGLPVAYFAIGIFDV